MPHLKLQAFRPCWHCWTITCLSSLDQISVGSSPRCGPGASSGCSSVWQLLLWKVLIYQAASECGPSPASSGRRAFFFTLFIFSFYLTSIHDQPNNAPHLSQTVRMKTSAAQRLAWKCCELVLLYHPIKFCVAVVSFPEMDLCLSCIL